MLDSFQSTVLNRKVSFSVYLPDRYDTATHQFRALHLLHGLDGDQNEWLENGALAAIQPKQVELRVIDGELDWATVTTGAARRAALSGTAMPAKSG